MSLAVVGSLGPIILVFINLYAPQGYSTNTIMLIATLPSFFTGVGNYLILPFALAYGRRPAFLVAALALVASCIGAAASQDFVGHLVARVFQGLTSGATESLLPLIMAEVTYVHQRGQVFGAYWSIQSIISNTLTLASSYQVAALSWRWYYGIMTIAGGFGLILAIFFAFETRFHRPPTYMDGQVIITDEFGNTRIMTNDEYQEYSTAYGDVHVTNAAFPQPKTYVQLLNPWPGKAPNASRIIATSFLEMAKCCTAPGIIYATLVPSVTTGCMIAMSLSYNAVLTENYGQSAASVGLINIASIPASFAAMFVAGYVGDKLSIAMARRNGGMHEPEHRLLPFAFGGVVGFAGLLVYAFYADNADRSAGWIIIYVSWGLYLFSFVLSLISSTTFAAEVWPKAPGPALVVVVGTKNIISFAISYALNPMLARYGYRTSYGILSAIHMGFFLAGLPVYYLNPRWRRWRARKDAMKAM
ncbi:Sugar transporter conserved site [Macrophomina phaseolina MS6]|uniref:Sugar transporter conserved site n=1 Tax=Macrophomina phaseolina (strain MS6) TaxID=1126212 RepID=K2SIU0_MACPH|nr:Sugar transporter conserved site [Macrophomina phaseolina MS6]